jgi:hypothetical protein
MHAACDDGGIALGRGPAARSSGRALGSSTSTATAAGAACKGRSLALPRRRAIAAHQRPASKASIIARACAW